MITVSGSRRIPKAATAVQVGTTEGQRGDHRLLLEADAGGAQVPPWSEDCAQVPKLNKFTDQGCFQRSYPENTNRSKLMIRTWFKICIIKCDNLWWNMTSCECCDQIWANIIPISWSSCNYAQRHQGRQRIGQHVQRRRQDLGLWHLQEAGRDLPQHGHLHGNAAGEEYLTK